MDSKRSFLLLSLCAVGMQAPWWAVSTSADYFALALPSKPSEFAFGIGYAVAVAVALVVNLLNTRSLWFAGAIGFGLEICGLVMIACLAPVRDHTGANVAFWIAIGGVVVSSFGSAITANSLYGIFAPLHERAPLMIQIGGVSCALLMGLLRVAYMYGGVSASGWSFFLICIGLVLVGGLCLGLLYYWNQDRSAAYASLQQIQDVEKEIVEPASNWTLTLRGVWKPLCALLIDFTVLFVCYPGLLSVLHCKPTTEFIVYSFLTFNAADALGKFLPLIRLPSMTGSLVLSVVEAAVFLPLFAGSVWLKTLAPQIFASDPYALIVTGLLGVGHGYVCASCFVLAPKHALDKQRAGSLTYAFNTAGIVIGTSVALVFPLRILTLVCTNQ